MITRTPNASSPFNRPIHTAPPIAMSIYTAPTYHPVLLNPPRSIDPSTFNRPIRRPVYIHPRHSFHSSRSPTTTHPPVHLNPPSYAPSTFICPSNHPVHIQPPHPSPSSPSPAPINSTVHPSPASPFALSTFDSPTHRHGERTSSTTAQLMKPSIFSDLESLGKIEGEVSVPCLWKAEMVKNLGIRPGYIKDLEDTQRANTTTLTDQNAVPDIRIMDGVRED
ncbi:hypothetical protein MAR_027345 [Mya arenaria]|uniref:Uncharacterized protein n=1 Tax=Mya arenaria TaxID=6604 RepID=A0ABY7EV45_MYAAR|nr:hypothetical protein MAR_027345 [Mya arenaria]